MTVPAARTLRRANLLAFACCTLLGFQASKLSRVDQKDNFWNVFPLKRNYSSLGNFPQPLLISEHLSPSHDIIICIREGMGSWGSGETCVWLAFKCITWRCLFLFSPNGRAVYLSQQHLLPWHLLYADLVNLFIICLFTLPLTCQIKYGPQLNLNSR